MSKKRYGPYSLGMILLLMVSFIIPVFAEVTSLETNSNSFNVGEQIKFAGKVEKGSNGLVTIVIRDLNNEFVMLSQAVIQSDDSFEKMIKINEKFTKHGVYNATSFILNMTKGVTTSFRISSNEMPIEFSTQETISKSSTSILGENASNKVTIIDENIVQKDIVQESVNQENTIAKFVDTKKDPKYYVDRYYNEPKYASWFDRNYPGLSIESAAGYSGELSEPQ